MRRYKEIFRLKEMLEKAGIPFRFRELYEDVPRFHGYQLEYFVGSKRIYSVIEHGASYGHDVDLLEIMGEADVAGWLTAEDVFKRIKQHYDEVSNCEPNKKSRRQ